jgi:riboflavin kinase/FMN adenylyltransferase
MKHIQRIEDAHLTTRSMLTIGVFDGVHRGHQYLVQQLVRQAHGAGQQAVVLTFYPHPDLVLRGLSGRYYLTSPDQKAELLSALGVDVVITHPFNAEVRHMRAAAFVQQLVDYLRISQVWVGSDFALGYQREGNVAFLRGQGAQQDFTVHEIDLMLNGDAKISSSAVREALLQGELEQAREWLGRGYTLRGEVVHGEGRGHKIGYPTANIDVWSEQVIPANGIYAGWATVNGERFMAATNVGVRPTFDGSNVTVEPYLLDFDRDIYGQTLEVTFEKRLRPEARFNGLPELIAQIGRDVEETRAYLSSLLGSR